MSITREERRSPRSPALAMMKSICHYCRRKVLTFVRPGEGAEVRRYAYHDNRLRQSCKGGGMLLPRTAAKEGKR